MARPSVSAVKSWDTVYESELVKVFVGTAEFPQDFWKVVPAKTTGKKAKSFYGELAWSDSRRYASDIDFQAWSI